MTMDALKMKARSSALLRQINDSRTMNLGKQMEAEMNEESNVMDILLHTVIPELDCEFVKPIFKFEYLMSLNTISGR